MNGNNVITYLPYVIAVIAILLLLFQKPIIVALKKNLGVQLTEDQRKAVDGIIEKGVEYALQIPKTKTKEERVQAAVSYILSLVQIAGVEKRYIPIIKEFAEQILDVKIEQ